MKNNGGAKKTFNLFTAGLVSNGYCLVQGEEFIGTITLEAASEVDALQKAINHFTNCGMRLPTKAVL